MKKISDNELKQISGGINWVVVTFVSAAISFITGIFDGLINPKKCNS